MLTLGKGLASTAATVALAVTCFGCGSAATNAAAAATPTPAPTAIPTATAAPRSRPTSTAAPTATVAPTPTAAAGVIPGSDPVPLAPGRYTIASLHWGVPEALGTSYPTLSFTVPAGWSGGGTSVVGKAAGSSGNFPGPDQSLPGLFAWNFDHGFKNPCTDHTPVVPAASSLPDGLLGVIAREPGVDAGPVKDAIVGGHGGGYVDITVTRDGSTCANGSEENWIWGDCLAPVTVGCEAVNGDARWGARKGDRERIYAIDVDGTTYTFFTTPTALLRPADRAEQRQFLDSIQFGPAG